MKAFQSIVVILAFPVVAASLSTQVVSPLAAQEQGERPRQTQNTRDAQKALDRAENARSAQLRQREYQTALEAAERAIQEDRLNPLAHLQAAIANLGLRDFPAANRNLTEAERLRPVYLEETQGLRERAWIELYQQAAPYVTVGDYEGAVPIFEDAQAIYQERPEVMITLGQVYLQLNNNERAIELLTQALEVIRSAGPEFDQATREGWLEVAATIPEMLRQAGAPHDEPARQTADEPAFTWGRPMPPEGSLIRLRDEDMNPMGGESVIENARVAVVTLEGTTAQGSGFIITSDGLALTNYHVVEGQGRIEALFADGRRVDVHLLRFSESADLALIQVNCEVCNTLAVAADDPEAGADVLVMGAPRGLGFSVSRGIVSAVRLLEGVTHFQTDAASNPGNSGGPMLEAASGDVVGILTLRLSGAEGIAFAISIADALRVLGVRLR